MHIKFTDDERQRLDEIIAKHDPAEHEIPRNVIAALKKGDELIAEMRPRIAAVVETAAVLRHMLIVHQEYLGPGPNDSLTASALDFLGGLTLTAGPVFKEIEEAIWKDSELEGAYLEIAYGLVDKAGREAFGFTLEEPKVIEPLQATA